MKPDTFQARWNQDAVSTLLDSRFARSPFGMHEGRVDCRGLRFPGPSPVKLLGFDVKQCDLSFASLDNTWIQDCRFIDVLSEDAVWKTVRDIGNEFTQCRFLGNDLRGTVFGGGSEGSVYRHTSFEKCRFAHCSFAAPEFDHCRFVDSRWGSLDLAGSRFTDCDFVGAVRGLWFRGLVPAGGNAARKPNSMLRVSFAEARLTNVTFSDGCDLSSVTPPRDGSCRVYSRWPERLARLRARAEGWESPIREEAIGFAEAYMTHALNQHKMLIPRADIDDIAGAASREVLACLDETL